VEYGEQPVKFPSWEGQGVGFSLDKVMCKLCIMRWLSDIEIKIQNQLTTEGTEEHGATSKVPLLRGARGGF
jgi:hypothetical protein